MESRSIKILRNATRSKATFKTYMYNLRKFRDFCCVKEYDDLLKLEPSKINQLLEDWIKESI